MKFPVFAQQLSGSFIEIVIEVGSQKVFVPSVFMAGAIPLLMQRGEALMRNLGHLVIDLRSNRCNKNCIPI